MFILKMLNNRSHKQLLTAITGEPSFHKSHAPQKPICSNEEEKKKCYK